MPIRRLLNAMWSYIVERLDSNARQELEERLAAANDAHRIDLRRRVVTAATAAVRGRSVIPGTATHGIRPPSWWKGDRAAYAGMRAAASQIEPVALRMADARGA